MHFKKIAQLAAFGFSGLLAVDSCSGSIHFHSSTSTMAKVNGVTIPQSRLEFIMKARAAQGQPDTPEARKSLTRRSYIRGNHRAGRDEKRAGQGSDFAAQLDIARQTALVRAYQIDYVKNHPVSDEELHKEYETVKAQMGDKEYKAHHILVASEAEAKDIIARIKKGESLKRLPGKIPGCGSKSKGGELDWSPAASYVQPFAEALTKAE